MPKRPYPRYQRRHDAILLSILENPLQTNKEIAKATGYSPSQISRILCSPDFLQLYDAAFVKVAHGARTKWLEHFPTGMNRLGFPKRRESDSSWMLAREVSMHDQGAFR